MNKTTTTRSWLYVIAPVYIGWRIYWANRLPITDCDEVYNYWEPLHFILYGYGMQTWEYAHQYALRTYAYLLPLAAVARIVTPVAQQWAPFLVDFAVSQEKLAVFLVLRASLGASTAMCELYFLWTLSRHVPNCHWVALVLLFSAGVTHSAAAFLPSSSWMMAWMVSTALYLDQRHFSFILVAVTTTLVVGWPFGVVMLLPLGISVLWKDWRAGTLLETIGWTLMCTIVVQGTTMMIDYSYYGKLVSPTVNIFTYNAAGGGDELYGTEPLSYYVKNLLLNLNIVAPLGMIAVPLCLLGRRYTIMGILSPLLLWLAITFPRPHKEERFLFPIYPLLVVGAIVTVDVAFDVMEKCLPLLKRFRTGLHGILWTTSALLSVSRTVALSKYYGAPLLLFALIPDQSQDLVCTCGEWYRFPGSFFLNGELRFLPSSFRGQLPQPFQGSRPENVKHLQPFNDRNLEQSERYVDANECNWIVDLQGSDCVSSLDVEMIHSAPFLDAERTSTLHRTLYVPFLHEHAVLDGNVAYLDYALWRVTPRKTKGST